MLRFLVYTLFLELNYKAGLGQGILLDIGNEVYIESRILFLDAYNSKLYIGIIVYLEDRIVKAVTEVIKANLEYIYLGKISTANISYFLCYLNVSYRRYLLEELYNYIESSLRIASTRFLAYSLNKRPSFLA